MAVAQFFSPITADYPGSDTSYQYSVIK